MITLIMTEVNRYAFDENMREKNDFYIFVPSDLDLWLLDFEFALLVTVVQHYISTKLEVSTAFHFRENWMRGTGRTE